jgi:hypothetical protein
MSGFEIGDRWIYNPKHKKSVYKYGIVTKIIPGYKPDQDNIVIMWDCGNMTQYHKCMITESCLYDISYKRNKKLENLGL